MAAISPATARIVFILALLVLWEAVARLAGISPILMAPPTTVLMHVARILANIGAVPDFYGHAWVTVKELIVAYGICAVIGVMLGLAFANSKVVGDAFEPILLILYALPKVILYPLLVLGLGIGMVPKIVFGVIVGIFVVIFNTAAGLRQVEPNYERLARSLGYGKTAIFFKVTLPAAAPTILAGLRLGFGYTIIGVMTAEMLVVNDGFGYLLDWASFNYFTPQLYALIVIMLGIGIIGHCLFGILERRWIL
ncbi:MAG: binding-protein-dependent transport system inner rane component [Rhodospirillales bacterium]|jgi:NitT/TauT family transport system permease protein|nr:binding-protein-dependent transport system inner rane component [Rhodospirillales bacterium]